jgi:cytochrome c6
MNKFSSQLLFTVAGVAVVLSFCPSARAETASETLYKLKCVACHGADGAGSAMGKKLGVHDFHSADVQKQTDAELTAIIANGKNKMPSYQKTLKADEISGLVAFVRSLAPAK